MTLLALAVSIYASMPGEGGLTLPRVLLLDEPDASLHPSMVADLLKVLQHSIVDGAGTQVIMTTHSPTTAALAPSESLYVIERSGDPRLFHVERDECLRRLTVGLPTLSVSVDNRRQVFVEAKADQRVYSDLFELMRSSLPSPFSLEFVAVGNSRGGGAEPVIRLVKELRGRGNMAIFGIVDRDDQNRSADGVMVNPEAYTLENLILHPGAIGSLLMRDGELTPESIGLPREVRSYSMDASDLQVAADHIAQAAPDQSRLQTLELVNGTELSMPIWFLNHDGHSLHDWLKEEFPKLRRHNDLMGAVCNLVYGDCPGLVPRSVWDLFNQLGS